MPANAQNLPIVDVDRAAVERMLERLQPLILPEDFAMVRGLVDTLARMTALVRERGTSIARIRRLFGISRSSERSRDVLPLQRPAPTGTSEPTAALDAVKTELREGSGDAGIACPPAATAPPAISSGPSSEPEAPAPAAACVPPDAAASPPEAKCKGHGRIAAADYLAACHIPIAHESLTENGPCPNSVCGGRLHRLKAPAHILRIVGSAPLVAKCWDCARLRCGLCGSVYTARAPEEAQGEKCSETACSMIAILHYRCGVAFNCLEGVQRNLDTPVPSSTQWEIVDKGAVLLRPVVDRLVQLAAQGEVFHNDDSYVRILALLGRRRAKLLAQGKLPDPDRTGLFTTAIVAIVASIGTIALFFTGRKHAGENLADVLAKRAAGLPPPIQMGDALTRNLPKGHEVVASNCITHGRRKIIDELDNYPVECRYVIERLALVYKVDAECKARGCSPDERLLAHQENSARPMEEAREYMDAARENLIEPNSGLGKAFAYFLERWPRFTLFLRKAGAPLDNNICERALKMAIKHRRSSLFYRSQRGAAVGDIYMTLIYTAELHGQNPFDYLTALLRNYNAVAAQPGNWLPWTYKDTLARIAVPETVFPERAA